MIKNSSLEEIHSNSHETPSVTDTSKFLAEPHIYLHDVKLDCVINSTSFTSDDLPLDTYNACLRNFPMRSLYDLIICRPQFRPISTAYLCTVGPFRKC